MSKLNELGSGGGGGLAAANNAAAANNKRPVVGLHVSAAKKESLDELKKQKLSAYVHNPAARLSMQKTKNPFEETNQQLVGEVDRLRREMAERMSQVQALDGENFQLREYINKLEVESVHVKELYEQSQLDLERRQLELDDWREQFLTLNEKYNEVLARQQLEVKRPATGRASMISMVHLEEVEEEELAGEQSLLNFTLTGDEGPAEAMRAFVKINQLMDKYMQKMTMCRKLSNKISYIFSKHNRLSIGGGGGLNENNNMISPYIIPATQQQQSSQQQQQQQYHQLAKSTKRRTTRRSSMLFVTNNDAGTLLESQSQHQQNEQQSPAVVVSPTRTSQKQQSQQRVETWPNSGANSNYHRLQHSKLSDGGRKSGNESNRSIRDEVMEEEHEEEMNGGEEDDEEDDAADNNISIQSSGHEDDEEEEEQGVVEDTQQEEDEEEEEEEEDEEEEEEEEAGDEENNTDQNGLDVILEATEVENRSRMEEDELTEEDEDVETEEDAVESQPETIEDDDADYMEPEAADIESGAASVEPTPTVHYKGPGSVHSKPPESNSGTFLPNSTYVIDPSDPSPTITPVSVKVADDKAKSRSRRSQLQPVQQTQHDERATSQQQPNTSRNVRFDDSDEGTSPVVHKKTPYKHKSTSSLLEKVAAANNHQDSPELDESIDNGKKLIIKPKPILRKSASMTQLEEAKPVADTPATGRSKGIFLTKKQKESQAAATAAAVVVAAAVASPPPTKPIETEEETGKSKRGRRKTVEHNNKDYDAVSNYLEEIVEQAAVSDSTNYTHSTTNRSRGRPRSAARANSVDTIAEVATAAAVVEVPPALAKPPTIVVEKEASTIKSIRKNATASAQVENNNETAAATMNAKPPQPPPPHLPPLPPNGGRKQKRPFESVNENSGPSSLANNNNNTRNLPPQAPARPPLPPTASVPLVNKNVLASNTSTINLKASVSTPTNKNTSPKKMRFTPPEETTTHDTSNHSAYNPHDDSARAGCNASLVLNLMSAGLEGSARRARKPVSYKEIPLNCKVRRDEKNQVVYKSLEKKGIMNPDEDLAAAAANRYNKENAMPH